MFDQYLNYVRKSVSNIMQVNTSFTRVAFRPLEVP